MPKIKKEVIEYLVLDEAIERKNRSSDKKADYSENEKTAMDKDIHIPRKVITDKAPNTKIITDKKADISKENSPTHNQPPKTKSKKKSGYER